MDIYQVYVIYCNKVDATTFSFKVACQRHCDWDFPLASLRRFLIFSLRIYMYRFTGRNIAK